MNVRNTKKGAKGVSLLIGISGDEQDPFEFHQMFSEGGQTFGASTVSWRNLLNGWM